MTGSAAATESEAKRAKTDIRTEPSTPIEWSGCRDVGTTFQTLFNNDTPGAGWFGGEIVEWKGGVFVVRYADGETRHYTPEQLNEDRADGFMRRCVRSARVT